MEKFKYRGKCTDNKKWVYGDLIQYKSGELAILESKFSQYGYEATEICKRVKVVPETVGQYICLNDINDKEIYKSDIVHCKTLSADRHYYMDDYIAVVECDKYNPCFVLKKLNFPYDSYEYDFIKCDLMIIEVIGNAHDYPKLLGL